VEPAIHAAHMAAAAPADAPPAPADLTTHRPLTKSPSGGAHLHPGFRHACLDFDHASFRTWPVAGAVRADTHGDRLDDRGGDGAQIRDPRHWIVDRHTIDQHEDGVRA